MPSRSHGRRLLSVFGLAIVVAAAETQIRDWQTGLLFGAVALMLGAMVTIPADLGDGEYDLIGCGGFLAIPLAAAVVWLAAGG